ncbi:MAG: RNA polymerase sigma-70 factor [Tannerellaceae bacterium]|jgi:RNA polymerase sigma-70 factor (ECF subfamily)|nr:RNA polymerase sigma-70 factor [Tannerellaceae bacterium]
MADLHVTDDTFLLSALRKGDKEAFNQLFRKYYPVLCAYARRFVELEDAREIAQDMMIWLWETRETVPVIISLSQYLFKAVYRRALDYHSRKQLKRRADTYFYEEMQEILQEVDFYQLEELSKRIREAIEALPPTYREAFTMHRFHEMSYKEIAANLKVSPKTIDYRIQQALKILRKELKDYL